MVRLLRLEKNITAGSKARVIKSKNLCVSVGWLDIGAFNGEPGYEYREDLDSLKSAAAHGGYCSISPFPTCKPSIDNKAQVRFILSRNHEHPVQVLPIGTLSKNREGSEMSEYIDLFEAGAVAFSDGSESKTTGNQLERSLEYLKGIDGLTIHVPHRGVGDFIDEGHVSVKMGLKGLSKHKEESEVDEALKRLRYTESKLLIHGISTSEPLRWAQYKKLKVEFSIPALNLIYSDEDVEDFVLNLKVDPPLRQPKEKRALIKAIESGQVDIIISNHKPLSPEEKDQPFGLSEEGASTIDYTFAALNTLASDISLERLTFVLSEGPYNALEIPAPTIQKGASSVLTIFDPEEEIKVTENSIISKSKNSPFIGLTLRGKVLGIINGSKDLIF